MTRRSAAACALDAAAALDAYLARPAPSGDRQGPLPDLPQPPDAGLAGIGVRDHDAGSPLRRGDAGRADRPRAARASPVPLHTDWLAHTLEVTGPVATLATFEDAASGAGIIPWALDGAELEEDAFLRMAAGGPGAPSLAGARILARQLRDAALRRHALAMAQVGTGRACPFDLHRLVPVPACLLALGPDHPEALAGLWARWGTTAALRHVARLAPARPPPPGQGRLALRFWAADWTPWAALARIRADWPALRLAVRPLYDLG